MFTLQHVCRFAAVFALMAATVAAQTNATNWNIVKALTLGSDVRVAAGPHAVSGKIQRITDDTVVVTSGKGQEMFTQQEVTRVSVRGGGHRKRHMLIGAGIGAAAGAALGGAAASTCGGSICGGHGAALIGATAGAAALVGALVGAAFPGGSWREVYKK